MTTNHKPATPLPWRVSPAVPAEVQQESGIYTIGKMGMDGAVNARYIAHAANAYPKLVEALRDLTLRCDGEQGVRADGSNIQTIAAHALLRELGEDA